MAFSPKPPHSVAAIVAGWRALAPALLAAALLPSACAEEVPQTGLGSAGSAGLCPHGTAGSSPQPAAGGAAGMGGAGPGGPGAGVAVDVSVGLYFACAVLADGSVKCWGRNSDGELGQGMEDHDAHPVPLAVPGLSEVVEVAAGFTSSCARRADGSVACWGTGPLGVEGAEISPSPMEVIGVAQAVEIEVGGRLGCARLGARLAEAGLVCWGVDLHNKATPALPVVEASGLLEVSLNANIGCTRMQSEVLCWGPEGNSGLCGLGSGDPSTAVPVPGLEATVAVAAGAYCSCAVVSADAPLRCWGYEGCGKDHPVTTPEVPIDVAGSAGIVQVAAGGAHACGRRADGRVLCWGFNPDGQLGLGCFGGYTDVSTLVPGVADVVQVSAGALNTCARTGKGAVYCWGDNNYGQVGDGTLVKAHHVPMPTAVGL